MTLLKMYFIYVSVFIHGSQDCQPDTISRGGIIFQVYVAFWDDLMSLT